MNSILRNACKHLGSFSLPTFMGCRTDSNSAATTARRHAQHVWHLQWLHVTAESNRHLSLLIVLSVCLNMHEINFVCACAQIMFQPVLYRHPSGLWKSALA